jgi:hypothetical protein
VLFGPVSACHRYRVLPRESTRIDPRPLLATSTVVEAALEVFAVDVEVVVGRDPVLAAPPQAATARALSDISAAPARKVMGLLRLMSLLRFGASTVAAVSGHRIAQCVVRALKPRSQGQARRVGIAGTRVRSGFG